MFSLTTSVKNHTRGCPKREAPRVTLKFSLGTVLHPRALFFDISAGLKLTSPATIKTKTCPNKKTNKKIVNSAEKQSRVVCNNLG